MTSDGFWIHRVLQSEGIESHFVDPAPIATSRRRRRAKTDRIDGEALVRALLAYKRGEPRVCAMVQAPTPQEEDRRRISREREGLAQLAEVGFFREVRVKGFDSMLGRTLVAARNRLVQITTELSNQIRGLMKTFGLVVPAGKGSRFEAHVRALLADQEGLAPILLPLLEAWRAVRLRAAELGRQLVASARRSEACQILMSVPGVGAVTATSFATAVEDPENFRRSRSVGAWLGLTTRRYQSGEVDYDGHISRRGDTHLRGLLYEAATVILTRTSAESSLRTWGLKLKERIGFKRAAVAVARKLAVVMHAMLRSGQLFDRTAGVAA